MFQVTTIGTMKSFVGTRKKCNKCVVRYSFHDRRDTNVPVYETDEQYMCHKHDVSSNIPLSYRTHVNIQFSSIRIQNNIRIESYCHQRNNNTNFIKKLTSFLTLGIARFSAFFIPRVVSSLRDVCNRKF